MTTFLFVTLNALSYFIAFCCFLPSRLKFYEKCIFFLLIFSNIAILSQFVGNIGVLILLVSSGAFICLIRKRRLLNLCVFLASYLFCVVCDQLFSLIWNHFVYPVYNLQPGYPLFVYMIAFDLFLAVICPILSRLISRAFQKLGLNLSDRSFLPILLNLLAGLSIFLFNLLAGEQIGYTAETVTFNCILFGSYFLISTVLIINIVKSYAVKAEFESRQASFDALQNYTTQVENMYSSLRSFKHDYQNIMLSMSSYIENKEMDKLETYFKEKIAPIHQQLSQDTAHLNQLLHIQIPELKGLISAKLLLALELNIPVTLEVSGELAELSADVIDVTRLIGIFLDNAIEAAKECDTPFISCSIVTTEKETAFIITNTFLPREISYASLREPGFSTKGKNRGIGLYTAKELVAKNESVFWDTEIKGNLFTQNLQIIR